jgi:hypothetical protein
MQTMSNHSSVQNFRSAELKTIDNNYKRQRINESTDFTMTNDLPRTKSISNIQLSKPNEEDKSEVELIEELKAIATPSKSLSNENFAGLKTISEGITIEYAETLQEKEKAIRDLESTEESKILDSHVDETSLCIQKSVFKSNKPLFYSNSSSSATKCLCGDSIACDIIRLIQ